MLRPPVTFRTSRLIVRAGECDDAEALFSEYTGNVAASRFLRRLPPFLGRANGGVPREMGSELLAFRCVPVRLDNT